MKDYMSFGGGVQSTAIALLAINKDPRLLEVTDGRVPELYLFADTGDESAEVYENVALMRQEIEASGATYMQVARPDRKYGDLSLSDHILTRLNAEEGGVSLPPMFVADKTGRAMPVFRACTQDYKANILDKAAKAYFNIPRMKKSFTGLKIRHWFGISLDEVSRTRTSGDVWRDFYYPLIDMRWKRSDCLKYIHQHGMKVARSACVYCPFHSNSEWRRIQSQPDEFAKAVAFEKSVHKVWDEGKNVGGLKTKPYLHRSRIPIDEVDFTGGQIDLPFGFDNECAGVCGV